MTISLLLENGCTEKFQRRFHVNQFVRLKDTHQALAPWSSIWSSAGSTVTLVPREFLSKASATTCRSMTRQGADGGLVDWVGWSPVGHAVATCWSPALGSNVAAGLETNRCVERQSVLDGSVLPQGFCQGLEAEVTQAAFATLQKVELKKNLTVRICEDLWRSVKGNAIKCAARYSRYWTLSATVEIAWAKPSWLQDRTRTCPLHWCLSTTGLSSRHQPQPGRAHRTMPDSETTPKLLLPKVVSCSRRMLTPSHWVHSCVHSIWKQRRHSLYLSVIYFTPSYTILHHLTPPQAKDAKVSPTTSTDFNSLGRARPLPPCPSRLRCPAADFEGRDSRFDSWPKPGNDMQWRHIWQIYGLKLGCQWTRKILQNHAKSACVCFQW